MTRTVEELISQWTRDPSSLTLDEQSIALDAPIASIVERGGKYYVSCDEPGSVTEVCNSYSEALDVIVGNGWLYE